MLAVTSIIKRWFGVQASRNLFGGACLTQKDICAVLLILCGEVMTDKPKPMTLRERAEMLPTFDRPGATAAYDMLLADALDQNDAMAAAVERAKEELEFVRVFVTSRQRIKKPEGEDLYDECVQQLDAALARHEGRDE